MVFRWRTMLKDMLVSSKAGQKASQQMARQCLQNVWKLLLVIQAMQTNLDLWVSPSTILWWLANLITTQTSVTAEMLSGLFLWHRQLLSVVKLQVRMAALKTPSYVIRGSQTTKISKPQMLLLLHLYDLSECDHCNPCKGKCRRSYLKSGWRGGLLWACSSSTEALASWESSPLFAGHYSETAACKCIPQLILMMSQNFVSQ